MLKAIHMKEDTTEFESKSELLISKTFLWLIRISLAYINADVGIIAICLRCPKGIHIYQP